jgi:aryl-alcohol dehydrogenase-like predicted oxidoreductase
MRYRQLGASGLTVSVVGLGCNNFGSRAGLDQTRAVVDAAIDSGITLFDTADVYGWRSGNYGGSEKFLGEVLKGRRDQIVLATKFGSHMGPDAGPPDEARGSRRYVYRAVEASLRRLQTDYIDLYQQHQPDRSTPVEETLAALDDLVTQGKIRYAGSSNFAGWQIVEADWVARTEHRNRFISAQNHYSLLHRDAENEILPACQRYGVGLLPYFPLANGLLTGKYQRNQPIPQGTRLSDRATDGTLFTDELFDHLDALEKYAAERDQTLLTVAIAGLAAQPTVSSVISGAMTPDQVRANAATADWDLTQDDLDALDAILPRGTSVTT